MKKSRTIFTFFKIYFIGYVRFLLTFFLECDIIRPIMKKLVYALLFITSACTSTVADNAINVNVNQPQVAQACEETHQVKWLESFISSNFRVTEFTTLQGTAFKVMVDFVNNTPPPSNHKPKEVRVYEVEGQGMLVALVTDNCVLELMALSFGQYEQILGYPS
jgi:hypothetical protein